MFTIDEFVQPDTIEEALEILVSKKGNAVLGGCAFLRMGAQRIGTAIDLSKLNLSYVTEQGGYIEIGAMTSLRELETSHVLRSCWNGLLPKAASNIIGVQFRNGVTVGASVFSKYGFSDIITALLALDTEVELVGSGRMSLQHFLEKRYEKDILTKIHIKKSGGKAAYQALRNSASDYPILNAVVSHRNREWRIVVGARPGIAQIAPQASAALSQGDMSIRHIETVATMAAQELRFGTNMRGTAAYRKEMCRVLVRRAIMEVSQ